MGLRPKLPPMPTVFAKRIDNAVVQGGSKRLWQLFALLKAAWQLLRNCHWQTAPFARRIDNTVIHVDSLSAYASFAHSAKDMAVSPALRAAETAAQ
ncbi:MAG: hypothetical protein JW918_09235, partial [Anaerolineae bacterium]|nr:hypothetical protein [Anaerolineae bacterium]